MAMAPWRPDVWRESGWACGARRDRLSCCSTSIRRGPEFSPGNSAPAFATVIAFGLVRKVAAWLLVPYLA
jgi:hypothetical protein